MEERPDCSVLQRTHSGGTGPMVVKVESIESGESVLTPSQIAELYFLRSRVGQLEKEKAELSAENQRLKNTLVYGESTSLSPGLPGLPCLPVHRGPIRDHSGSDRKLDNEDPWSPVHHVADVGPCQQSSLGLPGSSPQVSIQQLQEELSGDMSESWGPLGSDDEEVPDLGLGSHMGEEAPLCSQTDMEELRRSCSESQCIAGHANGQVSQVEVYPGCGVLCDVRSWQAANQAQSPTAMARMLLLGVFDMNTLMNSNLRGGRSRRPASHSQRSALDPHKINAIFNAILARFPLAKRGVIGSGINSKLSEIRFRSRRANPDLRFL
ncbi:uncharacterized protein LOC117743658 isoform X1 [Cyclopterus lumpus]|uniref:uncharacterized protein LOC117743658 isoform X1 n=1 Tax=Cyclopterus lumpus TaxID=8103 RepID=UPI001485D1A6|nr:uncharacterized protein LOC117743658 isoform X1 [Cyclopterus lumpus]